MSLDYDKQSDAQLLGMLDLAQVGWSRAAIAGRYGLRTNQVIGLLHRINRDADKLDAAPPPAGQTAAVKPENCDGGMPARWWVAGLRKQTEIENRLRKQGGRK